MTRHRVAVFAAVLAALTVSAVTGCKAASSGSSPTSAAAAAGGNSAAATAPAATSAAATSAPTAAAGGGGVLTGLPAACPTAAQVSSLLGISAGALDGSSTATTMDCVYGTPAPVTINFSTAEHLDPATAEAQLKAQGTTPNFQAVPGVGDAAFFDTPSTGGAYIAVLSGPLAFHIVAINSTSVAGFTALAKAILAG